jgi:hypothetical protein
MYWSDSGKLDCPVWHSVWSSFTLPNVSPTFFVLGQEDVDGGLWALLRLVPLVLLPLVIIQTFWLDHPHRPFFSYEDLLALGSFGDSLQISIILYLWPIELVNGKHCNH